MPRGHSQAPGRQQELSSGVPGQGSEGLPRLGGIDYEDCRCPPEMQGIEEIIIKHPLCYPQLNTNYMLTICQAHSPWYTPSPAVVSKYLSSFYHLSGTCRPGAERSRPSSSQGLCASHWVTRPPIRRPPCLGAEMGPLRGTSAPLWELWALWDAPGVASRTGCHPDC